MKRSIEFFDDSLLGGAALSIDDLEIVESRKIKWLFVNSEKNQDEIKMIE